MPLSDHYRIPRLRLCAEAANRLRTLPDGDEVRDAHRRSPRENPRDSGRLGALKPGFGERWRIERPGAGRNRRVTTVAPTGTVCSCAARGLTTPGRHFGPAAARSTRHNE